MINVIDEDNFLHIFFLLFMPTHLDDLQLNFWGHTQAHKLFRNSTCIYMTSLTLCNISRLVATMFISKSCEDNDDFGQIHDKMCQRFYK